MTERGPYGTPLQMLGVSGDVSERRRADEERERSERRFRAMFDSAYQFQALLDLECRVLEANPTALELLRDETGIDACADRCSGMRAGGPVRTLGLGRDRLRCREGGTDRQAGAGDGDPGRPASGDGFLGQADSRRRGRVAQLLVEGRDITARRRAEAELREVETLTTMGRIAARVAHEINNPLAGIQNSFLLLRDAIPADHPHYAYVGAIEREIRRIADVDAGTDQRRLRLPVPRCGRRPHLASRLDELVFERERGGAGARRDTDLREDVGEVA